MNLVECYWYSHKFAMSEFSSLTLLLPKTMENSASICTRDSILPTIVNSSDKVEALRHRQYEIPATEAAMTRTPLLSSPVLYPPSSSPPVICKKRKLFQTLQLPKTKKAKIIGGFLDDDENFDKVEAEETSLLRECAEPGTKEPDQREPELVDDLGLQPLTTDQVQDLDLLPQTCLQGPIPGVSMIPARTCRGKNLSIITRKRAPIQTFEQAIAQRSITAKGRAKKSYYGVDIHELLDEAAHQREIDKTRAELRIQKTLVKSIEQPVSQDKNQKVYEMHQMWTEKYRAKKFTELVGDERTHRSVLRWLKEWDQIVFPGNVRAKPKQHFFEHREQSFEKQHRKILLLTGPPGLGKTTLAHVCARQAGYEVLEINASDDRSRDVVKGRIKDTLGTETVKGVKVNGKARRIARPVCVVVDEVDGVVTGNVGSGGEGGFIKALIDLAQLDQKNSTATTHLDGSKQGKKRKGDNFKLLRPLILVCNDVYAPSLRPLRNSSFAEIVHVRKAPMEKVVSRLKAVFEAEHIACENDAIRRLCESSWGLGTRKQNSVGGRGSGEGDIRGVLVQGEWIAHKLRATSEPACELRLTRKWIESHLDCSQGTSGQKGLGRGGIREVVDRVFLEGAGLPNLPASISKEETRLVLESKTGPVGVADLRKRTAINALREMIDTCGDHDRLMTDCFAAYPTRTYQDDVRLSKPNTGYEWLNFHDCLSTRIFSSQEWELNPYLSTSACGFHDLFATIDKTVKGWSEEKPNEEEEADVHPFSGPKADFTAYEAEKQNRAVLTEFQAKFSAPLLRLFSSTEAIATELVPNVGRMLAPEVKPVVVGGSGGMNSVASVRKETEKTCVNNAVRVMSGLSVSFEKARVEIQGGVAHTSGGFVYRMEPPLDELINFTLGKTAGLAPAPIRYAVRQVLDQELRKAKILQNSMARHARSSLLGHSLQLEDDEKENENVQKRTKTAAASGVKRDFFGRIINDARPASSGKTSSAAQLATKGQEAEGRVWISFNEGYSNAVRKPITLKELMDSFE